MQYIDEAGQIVDTSPRVIGSVARGQNAWRPGRAGSTLGQVAKLIFVLVAGYAVLSYLDKQDLIDLPAIAVTPAKVAPAPVAPAPKASTLADGEAGAAILAGTRAQLSGKLSKGSQDGRYILETIRGEIMLELVDGDRWLGKALIADIEFTGEGGRFRILHIAPAEG